MPLSVGTRLGHFEILAPIGAGGMGEVYKARDTKLDREVAIKVLPAALAQDPERLARFEREAKVLASLNHPNIAAIYGVEERALVMELVEGDSPKGPLPFDEAWKIASQIADALEYAHDKGIIHRDLKPANVKVTPDGVVKLLDFGLAKAFSNQREPSASPENSPTLTLGATEVGVILGTAAYMAPEQARGKVVDKRADIWSFGVMLYELLTGERLFRGEDAAETLAAVIHQQPDLTRVPREARRVLDECLQKDAKQRLRDIGDAKRLLGEKPPVPSPPTSRHRSWLPWCIAAFLLLALMPANILHFREIPPEQPRVQFGIPLPGKAINAMFEISPDGRSLAIVGFEGDRGQLWIRPLDSGEARLLPGTEGATYPFWSPDSAYIGFFADGKLKKIAVSGGSPQTLCEAFGFGGTWNQDGVILFAGRGLNRVSSAGGVPVPVTKAASGETHVWPVFLPGGRRFLFAIAGDKPEAIGLYAGSLDGTPPMRLLPDYSSAAYVPGLGSERNGRLLFRRGTTLMAQPFDPSQAKLSGEMFPVAEQVGVTRHVGHGAFSASQKAALVYRSGSSFGSIRELVWMDRTGKRLGVLWKPGLMGDVALSRDEKQVALSLADPQAGTSDIWVLDIARGAMSRFTFGPGLINGPVWSPDGGSIVFSSRGASILRDLYRKPVRGAGDQELLVRAAGQNALPVDWSRDGRFLVYERDGERTNKKVLWILGLDGDRKPAPYLEASYNEFLAQFSPDGKWMAYVSDESGHEQVYVRAIPPTRPPVQVSIAGGSQPRWRLDGRELFYVSADQKVTAVPIRFTAAGVEAEPPQPLFDFVPGTGGGPTMFNYQPAADGQRFLMLVAPADEALVPITVVLNWQAGLKK